MITIFKNRLLLLIGLVLTLGLLVSCGKDDVKSTAIELLSFGPTGAKHGDTLIFIGNNMDKVTEIKFTGVNAVVAQNDFKKQTTEEIRVIVPTAAEQGVVTLKTPQGDIVSKSRLNLEVLATISSVTQEARPGANVTITGDYLNWVKRITFAKDKVVETFVSQSKNELVVTVPEDAETGNLILFYAGTDSDLLETEEPLTVTLPKATGLNPNPIKHQENLTITGTDMDLVRQIKFTNETAPVTQFVSQSATQVVVKVPAAAKKGTLTLVAPSGVTTVSSTELTMLLPVITDMTPRTVDPEANLTITGTDLDLVTSITFPEAPVVTTFESQSATQIVVKVPKESNNGKLTLGVKNSTVTVVSPTALQIVGASGPPTIAFPFYLDAVTSNWNGWTGDGWGGTRDYNNADPVREGNKSIKVNYVGGWSAPLQLGGANVTIAPYTTLKLSIYGAPGSGGKRVNVGINGADAYMITVVEGKWTDYEIELATVTSATKITELILKNYQGEGGYSVYVDAIGLN